MQRVIHIVDPHSGIRWSNEDLNTVNVVEETAWDGSIEQKQVKNVKTLTVDFTVIIQWMSVYGSPI